jgi:hypothetical protein
MRRTSQAPFSPLRVWWEWLVTVVGIRLVQVVAVFSPRRRRLVRQLQVPSYRDFAAAVRRIDAGAAEWRAAQARGDGELLLLRRIFGEELEAPDLSDSAGGER